MGWRSYIDVTHIDRRGRRYVLGRTADGYAIWDLNLGGRPLRRFPLTSDGSAQAQWAFEHLEGGTPVFASPGGEWFAPPTAEWTEGRPMSFSPMRLGQILDGAFKLYRMRFWTLLAVVALVLLPLHAIVLVVTLRTLEPVLFPTVAGGPTVVLQLPSAQVGVGTTMIQFLFVAPFLTASVVKVAADTALGRLATVGSIYRAALPRVHSILWVTLLTILPSLVFFVAAAFAGASAATTGEDGAAALAVVLVVLGLVTYVFMVVRLSLGPSAVMVEDVRGVQALRRSWRLLQGITGKALGAFVVAVLIVLVIYLVLSFVLSFITGLVLVLAFGRELLTGGMWPAVYVMQETMNALIGILTTPFLTLVLVLLYFDARMRKEGFDLAIMAQQIAG